MSVRFGATISVLAVAMCACLIVAEAAVADSAKAANFSGVRPGQRIVIVPPFVRVSELTAGGVLETKADWSATAKTNVEAALEQECRDRRWGLVPYKAPADPERLRVHSQVGKVYILVALTIQEHYLNQARRLPSRKGRFEWTLGGEVGTVREDEDGADYLLFSEFADAFSSGGRQAMNVAAAVLGGPMRWGRQALFAGLVDLRTGDVVWFNRLQGGGNDLRAASSARAAVKSLFADIPQ